MTLKRIDNVSIVLEDLQAGIDFFLELGLELEGQMIVEGDWVGHVIGLTDVKSEIAMLRSPEGNSRLELTTFHRPAAVRTEPADVPANALGIRRIMFTVEDIDDTLARLEKRGAVLIGQVTQYQDLYRLCYLRGPEGIMLALAEELF
jgi:catechol 2,3-dioxygenase-like lactoylglutathione lyase family enzyme